MHPYPKHFRCARKFRIEKKKKKNREVRSCGCLYVYKCDNPISIRRELVIHYN